MERIWAMLSTEAIRAMLSRFGLGSLTTFSFLAFGALGSYGALVFFAFGAASGFTATSAAPVKVSSSLIVGILPIKFYLGS
jgi:hypothetical protein